MVIFYTLGHKASLVETAHMMDCSRKKALGEGLAIRYNVALMLFQNNAKAGAYIFKPCVFSLTVSQEGSGPDR